MRHILLLPALLLCAACTLGPITDNVSTASGSVSSSASGQSIFSSSDSSESFESSPPSQSSQSSKSSLTTPPSILSAGDINAPVTLLLFTHHSCAYCKTFHEQLISKLDPYIRSDQIRVQIVAIILNKYAESVDQTKMLICANQQNKGMAVHGALFNSTTTVVRSQQELGLDTTALDACLAAEETTQLLEAQALFTTSMDVELVPTYFINETRYQGLPSWPDLRGQIELEL